MVRQLLPISALLFGSALLLFAGGINGLILPVRGTDEGFSAQSLGLLGAGWAVGYIAGCWFMAGMVARVGHIRAFSVMCAFAAVAILMSALLLTPAAWIPLRAVSGFCFAGAAMIVESWLNERAEPSTRGRIFGIYTMVNLLAVTAGQMALTLGDTNTMMFFVVGAIFYCLALVPTAISSTQTPRPLTSVSLDLRALWRNSPVAVFAVFFVGVSNSAFGALAAVYAGQVGLVLATVALFASLPVLVGAISQLPVGWLSDRMDRRWVLIGVCGLAVLTDIAFVVLAPEGRTLNLVLSAILGASIYAMYPILIAHANDHAPENTAIQTSGGLLIVFGFGAIVGPVVAGFLMEQAGATGLFVTSAAAHALVIAFTLYRISRRVAVPEEDKGNFVYQPGGRVSTPETGALAYGEDEEEPLPPAEELGDSSLR
jgi:MFS family permease